MKKIDAVKTAEVIHERYNIPLDELVDVFAEIPSADTLPKYDQDKPRLDLVPPGIIEAVGKVRTYGITKYSDPQNWRQLSPERIQAAMMRHLCAYMRDPKSVDDESGLPHLWHMACNIAFLCEMFKTDIEFILEQTGGK